MKQINASQVFLFLNKNSGYLKAYIAIVTIFFSNNLQSPELLHINYSLSVMTDYELTRIVGYLEVTEIMELENVQDQLKVLLSQTY